MSKLFKVSGDVVLVNGYVSDKKTKSPITHPAFVKAQNEAHRLISLAAKFNGKNFVAKKLDNIAELVGQVDADLANETASFIAAPKAPKGSLQSKLAAEALEFISFDADTTEAAELNSKLQKFKTIQEFEENGLFFSKGICKLNKVYTLTEIIQAAKEVNAIYKGW